MFCGFREVFFMGAYTFGKHERLKSRTSIQELFLNGKVLYSPPVKILYKLAQEAENESFPVKCGVSVSKKKFRKAVERNLLKRRMRESYRQSKNFLIWYVVENSLTVNIFILFHSDREMSYAEIDKGIKKGLEKLKIELEKEIMQR